MLKAEIAAIAAVNDLVLVTANPRGFRLFRGLRLEDWTKPHRG
jgi:predicted nucleic acid-binding protein